MTQVHITSYGRPALDALRDIVAEAKADDAMAPVTVIAPNELAGTTLRRHLAHGVGGRPGVAGIEVTTLRRLADRLALPLLGGRRPAVRPVLTAALRTALTADPGPFRDVADHPGTVDALARAYAELREIDDDGRAAIAATAPLAAAVVRLHDATRALLAADFYDDRDLLDAAADATRPTGSIVVYLPQDPSPGEARLTAALAADHVVLGATRTVRGDTAPFATVGLAATTGTVRTATRVLTASDSDDEVRAVVREVVARLATTPAHRIAVLYGDRIPYARLLHEQLAAAGIAVNGPGVRPVAERAYARVLLDLLDLAGNDLPRADLFRALAAAPLHDFAATRVPLSAWERTSRSAGVVGGADWHVRLGSLVTDLGARVDAERAAVEPRSWLVERLTRDADTAEALRAFAVRLRQELHDAAELTTWSALAGWARGLVDVLVGDVTAIRGLPEEERAAAAAVSLLLEELARLDPVAPTATFAAFRDVVRGELAARVPRTGRFGDGVLVAPVSSAVGLDLDVVWVVGLSEDLYPGRSHPDALLPDDARTAGGLTTQVDHRNRRFRRLLAAYASADEVVATFPRGDLRRSTVRLPSRWLLPTLRELVHDADLPATEWERAAAVVTTASSYAGALLAADLPGTEQEWRIRAAVAGGLRDDAVDDAVAMIRGRAAPALTRYDGLLTDTAGLPELATSDTSIAPTTLEGYATCPHAYFVQRLLGVRPLEQPEDTVTISAADIGNLVHGVMDRLVRGTADLPRDGEPWSAEHRARLDALLVDAAEEFTRRGLTGHPRLWAGERMRIARDLERMLDADDAWRREHGASVVASEMRFGSGGHDPVAVDVPGGRVLFHGSADKVDVTRDGTVVVTDIKTGRRSAFGEIATGADPFVGGTKLQLPVYGLAARAQHGTDASPVRADYWFVRKDPGRIGVDVTADLLVAYGATVGTLVRSIAAGLFPPKAPDGPDVAWVQCPYCNPDGLGHAEVRDRYLAKRTDPALADLVAVIDPGAAPAPTAPTEVP